MSARFRARRIPGTLSLAVTNLIASFVLVDQDAMNGQPIHEVAVNMAPPWLWGLLFLVSGVGLVVAACTLRRALLHGFGALSLLGWVGITVASFLSDLTDSSFQMSPLALALFVWMLLGPLAMLLVPLLVERHDQRQGGRSG